MEELDFEGTPFIPHDVAIMVIRQDMPLVKAWRFYKGLTVDEVADLAGLMTEEVLELEAGDNKRSYCLEKIAQGLNLNMEQIIDL